MANLEKLVEELSALTVLEAAELSKLLEEKWGVSAAAPVAVAAAGGELGSTHEIAGIDGFIGRTAEHHFFKTRNQCSADQRARICCAHLQHISRTRTTVDGLVRYAGQGDRIDTRTAQIAGFGAVNAHGYVA